MRSVIHRGDSGYALEQVILDENGNPENLTGLTVSFRLRMEFDSANIIDDSSAVVELPQAAGKVKWNVSVPADAPLGVADGVWAFSNGQQVPAGQFLIEEAFGAGVGGDGQQLATYALTDLATVKSRLSGLRNRNTVVDQLLIYLINVASWEMMDFCGREIAPRAANPSTRQIWLPENGYARIPDCRQLAGAVRVNPDGTDGTAFLAGTATTLGDFTLKGYWQATNTFTAIEFGGGTGWPWYTGLVSPTGSPYAPYSGLVRLTGSWGWSAVPPNIGYLCAMTVKSWYEDERVVPQTFTEDVGPAPDLSQIALPGAVRAALYRYRNLVIG